MANEIKNEFSWSKSRDEVFRTCSRKYFFHYYGYWEGWSQLAPDRVREIYILKKLVNRWIWVGDLVHRAVGRSLTNLSRGVEVLGADRVVEVTLDLMRNEFRASRRGDYRHVKAVGLFEHEYGLDVPDEAWQAAAGDVETALRNFYGSDLFARLAAFPKENFLEVETLSSFDFEGTKIWVVLDAAWKENKKGLTIADWKTGRSEPDSHELQMTGYALYASDKWGVDPADLTLMVYNLSSNSSHQYRAGKKAVDRTLSYIRGSIADMKSKLADPSANTPLAEDQFPKLAVEKTCSQCNFLRVCQPEF